MQTDFLIVGQGLAGTFLSWELQRANQSFIVIDDDAPFSAGKVAAGIINPVTGRRIVKTWLIDELMACAWKTYHELADLLQIDCIQQKNIIDFYPTLQMKTAFEARYEKDKEYLSLPSDENDWKALVNYDFGYGVIDPSYWMDLQLLLPTYRKMLVKNGHLINDRFDISQLHVTDNQVKYKDITAGKIIFCDGVNGFNNPYFKNLPFAPNKGEALLVEVKDFPTSHVLKKGFKFVPWKDDIFWVGAPYLWEFEDDKPTKGFYDFTKNWMTQTIKAPFKIVDHLASVRPATLERRPFVGLHPAHKNVGIFNGLGSKGCSLAPFFAKQFVDNIIHEKPIEPEASVERFTKVLARN